MFTGNLQACCPIFAPCWCKIAERRHTLRSFRLANIYVVNVLTNQISVYMK